MKTEWTWALNLLESNSFNVYIYFLKTLCTSVPQEWSMCWQEMETLYYLQCRVSVTLLGLPINGFSMHSFQLPTEFWALPCCFSENMSWHMGKCKCQSYTIPLMVVSSASLALCYEIWLSSTLILASDQWVVKMGHNDDFMTLPLCSFCRILLPLPSLEAVFKNWFEQKLFPFNNCLNWCVYATNKYIKALHWYEHIWCT